ncbi:MAG: CFI-box-CTERM domain-containing protein [Spirosomataceae bacterium]
MWHTCPRCKGRGTVYTSSGGGCFITTATISQVSGKGDNCTELTLFRNYRDNWLAEQAGGQELINRYYEVAPQIVTVINRRMDSDVIYDTIWKRYLQPCFDFIQEGKFIEARELYTEMVLCLEEKFLHDNPDTFVENQELIHV